MTVGEFINYVKENNIPEDYEILIGYDDDSDYRYGYYYGYHESEIIDIEEDNGGKTITLGTNLTVH